MKSAELTSAERLFEWQAASIDRVKVVFKSNFIEALAEHDSEIINKTDEMKINKALEENPKEKIWREAYNEALTKLKEWMERKNDLP